ncbi:hypothetical protein ACO0LO_19180 [Undibacterium sp. TJN25]|uniref:hypothetical protein n=1 Tax=Undibacterium sp. TJN25 TaxID=3413056 RepID=UPI003BF2EC65
MAGSVFAETEFFLLLFFSFIVPFCLNAFMMWKKSISRTTVLASGVILIAISGLNILLLQHLKTMARVSPSLFDDRIFASEISVALYVVPAVFGGIGVNLISHILISHLRDAEKKFDRDDRRNARWMNRRRVRGPKIAAGATGTESTEGAATAATALPSPLSVLSPVRNSRRPAAYLQKTRRTVFADGADGFPVSSAYWKD